MDSDDPPCPSPYPHLSSSSSFLEDISNFKTPKRSSRSTNLSAPSPSPKFFTASKQTPRSSAFRSRTSLAPPPRKSAVAARKLKAVQVEQSQSSRKVQIKKEQSLKSLSKSITVWLNFLLQNPVSCGCDISIAGVQIGDVPSATPASNGKRDSGPGISVGVDSSFRTPKRQRKTWSRDECRAGKQGAAAAELPNLVFSNLRDSLKDVCSFDDLKQRMGVYLSLRSCKEVFEAMNQVTKTIDEGRLNMKSHCPIVTDLGLKDKAIRILLCYNPIWLRIGLYIIFGGDSLVLNEDSDSDHDILFLKMVIDKLFFTHEGLAKAFAYNKSVEGIYRPGYYEKLGNVILKKTLLLVLILDEAKCQSSLPLEFGIDGLDGGSPLLFKPESWIKSSSQVIHEFLSSDVMHGEGNLLTHLMILGYKVSHQQGPLVEYDFMVTDLFVDLQDGLKLCRAIQLLLHNSSILMKIVLPSDTRKKNLANCDLVLQYLRQAGVPLHDEDNMVIVANDVVNGDKELTLSLLWNIYVHLQLPLLVDKTCLVGEISKIRGLASDLINSANSSSLGLLLNWIQAVCENYDCGIDNFHSLVDGKAIWCLLDYYFQKELHNSCSLKEVNDKSGKASIMSVNEYSDALYNFILSQKLTTLLGNFPEVLQISELLQYNVACSDRSVVILLVFLASQLFVKKNVDRLNFHKLLGYECQSPYRRHMRMVQCLSSSESLQKADASDVHHNEDAARKFKVIQAWWQDMAERNRNMKPAVSSLQTSGAIECSANITRENAARTVQSHIRGFVARRKFLKIIDAVTLLQTVFRAWLKVRPKSVSVMFTSVHGYDNICDTLKHSKTSRRYAMLFGHRHSFLRLKRSALLIQHAVRRWLYRRHNQEFSISPAVMNSVPITAATILQKFVRGWMARSRYIHQLNHQKEIALNLAQQKVTFDLQTNAAVRIQLAWKKYMYCNSTQKQHLVATTIQCNFRRWLLRKRFLHQVQAVRKIQSYFRMWSCVKAFQRFKIALKAATVIQSFIRGWIARKEACARRNHIIEIQRHCRGFLVRRDFLIQRDVVVKMQCVVRSLKYQKALNFQKDAALEIQRFIRGHLTRNRLLGGACQLRTVIPASGISIPVGFCCFQLELYLSSVKKLQRWWKGLLLMKLRNKSAIIIQSCTRGWIAKRKATVHRHSAVVMREAAALVIQRFFRGHLTRNRLLGAASQLRAVIHDGCVSRPVGCCSLQLKLFLFSIVKLQRWWKGLLWHKLMIKSAIVIQSNTRRWIARRKATVLRHNIVVIQSQWKGYVARKNSKQQLLELRLRVRESTRNVDDSKRLINRLLAALSELRNMKSLSDILHTCSTLDMATGHSQRCCEELVAAGAINTLLGLIQSVSRSIPDQEVLKHALSTLRNLARYPHLREVLIQSHGSVQTIVMELRRNKEDVYFIASELLKKIFSTPTGVEAIRTSPALLKRLHNLVEELTKNAIYEKRNARGPSPVMKENRERRLKEAAEILKLITRADVSSSVKF